MKVLACDRERRRGVEAKRGQGEGEEMTQRDVARETLSRMCVCV